jgi:hydrogenase maturation protein HypF
VRERRRVTIHGLVQGVFFRETVRRIAESFEVAGFVRNVGADRVEIEAEGEPATVAAFVDHVLAHPPPRARVERVHHAVVGPAGDADFVVAPTQREG